MKMRLCMVVAATMMVSGCGKNESNSWNGEIRLASGVETVVLGRSTDQTLQGNQIDGSVTVGVFIEEDATTPSTQYPENLKYDADGSGALTIARGEEQPYFPQSGKGVNIYAYAPRDASYVGGLAGTLVFTVKGNQSDKAGYLASDLLWGQPMKSSNGQAVTANPVARDKAAVSISFAHLLSKVDINLIAGAGMTADMLKGATVSILQVQPTVSLTMADGSVVTTGTKTDVVVAEYGVAEAPVLTLSAIIPPQSITAGAGAAGVDFLKVQLVTGGELYYKLESNTTFESGKVYTYDITTELTKLTVTTSISDWSSIGINPVTGKAVMGFMIYDL